MDTITVDYDKIFGHIEHVMMPERREGNRLVYRYRVREYNRVGVLLRDEVRETGASIILPDEKWARNDLLRSVGKYEFVDAETWRDRVRRLFGW